MIPLSPEEEAYYTDLRENMDAKINEFKEEKEKELASGKKEILLKELQQLQDYVKMAQDGLVSDLQVNIEFKAKQCAVLETLLKN